MINTPTTSVVSDAIYRSTQVFIPTSPQVLSCPTISEEGPLLHKREREREGERERERERRRGLATLNLVEPALWHGVAACSHPHIVAGLEAAVSRPISRMLCPEVLATWRVRTCSENQMNHTRRPQVSKETRLSHTCAHRKLAPQTGTQKQASVARARASERASEIL